MIGHFPTLELPYMCNDLHINLCYKNNVFYDPFSFSVKELSSLIHLHAEVCVTERLTTRTPDLEFRGSSLACLFFFDKTRNFTPFCLSSPRCINGYRRHTARGVNLQRTSIPSRGE